MVVRRVPVLKQASALRAAETGTRLNRLDRTKGTGKLLRRQKRKKRRELTENKKRRQAGLRR